ncbi:hypothetical protein [Brevibacillus borstelensis]|uniref:hypothetical protein n=1 Tax=Brevibacillus borstelensis TaxID=45462 RepID=UPI001D0B2D77|nr:hypothetical protein [Brevibacillus borstelensis]MCC0567208.1 hypothetical protein [Brevibacillus borstelensis]
MNKLTRITQDEIIKKFPWAAELNLAEEMNNEEGYFYDLPKWQFGNGRMKLIHDMFQVMSNYFESINKTPEVTVYEVKDVFGFLRVELISPHQNIYAIKEQYEKLSEASCSECGDAGTLRMMKNGLLVLCESCHCERLF